MTEKPRKQPKEQGPRYVWGGEGTPPDVRWEYHARPLWVQAVPDLGAALLLEKERVELRDVSTGAERWTQAERALPEEVALDGAGLYLATSRELRALRPENGAPAWRYQSGGAITGLALDSQTVYASTKGPLLALDRMDGKPRWKTATAWEPDLHPLPQLGLILVDNPESETVEAYRARTGEKAWDYSAHGQPVSVGTGVGEIVPVSCHGAGLTGLHAPSGESRWTVRSDGAFETPAVALDGTIYATDGDLYALRPDTGELLWKRELADERDRFFAARSGPGMVLAETWRGRILALNPADGAVLWEQRLGQVHGVIHDADTIYVRYVDDQQNGKWSAAAIDARTGQPRWALHEARVVADLNRISGLLLVELRNYVMAVAAGPA